MVASRHWRRALVIAVDGHPGVEEAPDPAGRSTVEAVGQQPGGDAEVPAVADFLRLGGKPGEGGMLQDVVGRQQPAQEQGLLAILRWSRPVAPMAW